MGKKLPLYVCLLFFVAQSFAQRTLYWVGKSIYQNNFSTAADIADWQLVEDNGTGSWTLSGNGSALLTMDNDGYANRIFNVSGSQPKLFPLDKVKGIVQFHVIALTGDDQFFFVQAQEFDAGGNYITEQNILSPQNTTGFFTIELSDITWNASTTQIRFMIGGENHANQQGTIEFNYFSYYNTVLSWSNTANWSLSSGGTSGAALPDVTDEVVFDNNSMSNTVIDLPVSVHKLITQPAYHATIIQSDNGVLTVGAGGATFSGGAFAGGSDSITFQDLTISGAQFTSTTDTLYVSGAFQLLSGDFMHQEGTVHFNSASAQSIPPLNYFNLRWSGTGVKTASGDIMVAGDLINNSNFVHNSKTILFNGSKQHISGDSVTDFYNLTLSQTDTLILDTPQRLVHVLTLDSAASFDSGNHLILLAASPTSFASIASLKDASFTGNITVQKYIYSTRKIYRYLSSPVSNAFISDWQQEIPVTGTFNNPSTGPGILSSVFPSVYYYDESKGATLENGYVGYPSSGNSAGAPLQPGKGYAVLVRDNPGRPNVMDVTGTPNKGTLTFPLSYTYSGTGIDNDGWNLVGNPYPSAIDWSLIPPSDRPNLDNAIYYQDDDNASSVVKSWVDGVGVNCTNAVISSSLGFWVKANGANPMLTFREDYKTTATPSFYKLAAGGSILRIRLDSAAHFCDETVLRFREDATAVFDSWFDAYKMSMNLSRNIGSYSKDRLPLSINSMAQPEAGRSDTIPLFITRIYPGKFSLSVTEQSIAAGTEIYLLDGQKGVAKRIDKDTAYSFEASDDPHSYSDRFKVVFKVQESLGIAASHDRRSLVHAIPNPVSGGETMELHIALMELQGQAPLVRLSDMMGRVVYTGSLETMSSADASLIGKVRLPSDLDHGLYYLIIDTGAQIFTKAILVK